MRSVITVFLITSVIVLASTRTTAAVDSMWTITAQVRPRLEFRNGYRSLPSPNRNDGVVFVSQRTRMGVKYQSDRRASLSAIFQDVRTWGDESSSVTDYDADNFDVFRAFIDLTPDSTWTIRIGRQGIRFDEDRILGDGEWAQQGRSHDAFRIIWKRRGAEAHIAYAHNQRGEPVSYVRYNSSGNYQDLGVLWLNFRRATTGVSLLGVGEYYAAGGAQQQGLYDAGTPWGRGTVGGRIEVTPKPMQLRGEAYYQFGTRRFSNASTPRVRDVRAFTLAASIGRDFGRTNLAIWYDIISGDSDPLDSTYRVFDPPYATGHKFYGWADYFVNMPADTRGLGVQDLAFKIKSPLSDQAVADLQFHYFWFARNNPGISGGGQKALGFEADAMVTIPLIKNIRLQAGYSAVIPTDALKRLHNGDGPGHWVWTMLDFNVK